ncbi:hypothetical protein [Bacillus sp. T33-2]|uniref:hypothetical protein n=1 Tax=Bacillus sp. T33-2 TaxID=2054168 RepID=UPI0015E114BE|nr:hypothetical protein [Bacillus sp. T33-2]
MNGLKEEYKQCLRLVMNRKSVDLDCAYKQMSSSILHSSKFDEEIEFLIEAYFELKS